MPNAIQTIDPTTIIPRPLREHRCAPVGVEKQGGMLLSPHYPCDFKAGDVVLYTNDYGAPFEMRVLGFTGPNHYMAKTYGHSVFLDSDCWWSPVHPQSLELLRRERR